MGHRTRPAGGRPRSVARLRRLLPSERGQAIVEFALSSAMFFAMLFAIVGLGLATWRYNMVADLAQEGARWATVHGSNSTTPASAADVQNYVQGRATGFTVTVTTTPVPSTVTTGSTVTVQVQSTFTPFTNLVPTSALTLQSTASMLMSR